jgi:hypothetical protein
MDEMKTAAKRAKLSDDAEITPASFLKELWKDTQASADKLFIIQRPHETNKHAPASWHLVQVDPEETNNRQAKNIGEYHIKYYVQNVIDSKKRLVRNCRYWPLIQRRIWRHCGAATEQSGRDIGTKTLHTRMVPRNGKHIVEQGIIGPFNFSIDQTEGQHRISQNIWKALERSEEVKSGSVDISDLNRVTPLQ